MKFEEPYSSNSNGNNSSPSTIEVSFRGWNWILVFALLTIITGIFILINPEFLYRALSYLTGIGLLLIGIFKLYPHKLPTPSLGIQRRSLMDILSSLSCITMSVLLFLYPMILIVTLPFLLGIIVLLYALFMVYVTRYLPQSSFSLGLKISGVVALLISLSLFIYPESWGVILGRGLGVLLIFLGGIGVALPLYYKSKEWKITFSLLFFLKIYLTL